MSVEEALEIVQLVIEKGSLNKVEEIVLRQCWEGKSYLEIARDSGYEVGYVTDVGARLWQALSKVFGKKVTKNNFPALLRQQYIAKHIPVLAGSGANEQQQSQASILSLLAAKQQDTAEYRDWGEAVDVAIFYGRETELATLKQWMIHDSCRLVALLGMGGVGKTALAAKLAEQVQNSFEYLFWRSLRNAPPIEDLLRDLIQFLSHQSVELPDNLDSQIACLMSHLRSSRCLLVLDNYESILRSGERAGRYCSGYEGYGKLLRRIADERHQSCLILTSREKSVGIAVKEGKTLPVRSLHMIGLPLVEAQKILGDKDVVGSEDESKQLIERYSGNPLALKIAATSIRSLFGGDIRKFLDQGTVIFGDLRDLLDRQFNRLSPAEKKIMHRLVNCRDSMSFSELRENCSGSISPQELLEALESLVCRSLIERRSTSFTQQSVVVEYLSAQVIAGLTPFPPKD
ncbi:MAG: hypothetical protein CLLPBCKN_000919 [Chroococcidiopsis cubana SAG 39.79]|uniref:NB-ARC domain-containing protein n=1 Tax=Chroococcidiopsis cubana SAG 39.79 TaxID=388085 RepID=A0AB37UCI4_9CYAN|nr:NB-ARC domain-containing protein [Chroococcidiopsis cubana]MDZ4871531.1 hypothetical protein [Chroococcidiopsis cubana SAG 39.79]PSB64744.1 hypothetical protein C7B79_08510 [Chroococcidiopsis cubana CCALA 043]RUT04177.1 hypothetical protein DSM107010_58530 [Chroococcidiopsis cubana SAG 39.79]